MKIDKSEKSIFNRKKFKKVDDILLKEFGDLMYVRGACHQVWQRKKQLLKELYNIDWQSPEELNEEMIFD